MLHFVLGGQRSKTVDGVHLSSTFHWRHLSPSSDRDDFSIYKGAHDVDNSTKYSGLEPKVRSQSQLA